MNKYIVFLFLISFSYSLQSQNKEVEAKRISSNIIIDGVLDEEEWGTAEIANDFIQYDPLNGPKSAYNTEVKFLYNNRSIYVAAWLFDESPDSILSEFGKRDNVNKHADDFSIEISPYCDLNKFVFTVIASGVQADYKITNGATDYNWNVVWKSKIKITEFGWCVEMEIPYSVLRFPNTEEQLWDINIRRKVRRVREISYWQFVDKKITIPQMGKLTGINGIESPLRLSVLPYSSFFIEKTPENSKFAYSFNYGADVKYGINESYTMDMTLIPDFGQTQSDDVVLNLTPFEVQYSEKRQFFTEGTEIINKGGLLYSRRIGSQPQRYSDASAMVNDSTNDITGVDNNPSTTKVINVTKISGRNSKGLGIGVLNAMTSNTFATLTSSNNEITKISTQPFTNYNVMVFDQLLKNKSYLSFANSNVKNKDYYANVSALVYRLADKNNDYVIEGNGKQSVRKGNGISDMGFAYFMKLAKISGNWRYSVFRNVESDNYNPTDLGYLHNNNETTHKADLSYSIFKPIWKLQNMYNSISIMHSRLYEPNHFSFLRFNYNYSSTSKKYFSSSISVTVEPIEGKDYYQYTSFQMGKLFVTPSYFSGNLFLSSDYRKKFAFDLTLFHKRSSLYSLRPYSIRFAPRVRFSDHVFGIFDTKYYYSNNEVGYTVFLDPLLNPSIENNIIYANRDHRTVDNILSFEYVISTKMSVNFRLRHYWSSIKNHDYLELDDDGFVVPSEYNKLMDINENRFNVDMGYTWYFAPGSEMSVVWKNSITDNIKNVEYGYISNLSETILIPATNFVSLKLLYYLDYKHLQSSDKL